MTITVVIPAFKARNFLAEALASVAAQTRMPDEVIVVDDASPEPIDDIVGRFQAASGFPPLRVVRHERNQGLGATRNTGIRQATGDWVALLDHDDLWKPEHLAALVAAIGSEHADLGFATSELFVEENGARRITGAWGPDSDTWKQTPAWSLFQKNFIQPSATLIRRSALLEVNGFDTDPRVHMCEDLDLWLRLVRAGCRIAHSGHRSLLYRQHAAAATSRQAYMARQNAHVRAKHLAWVPGPWFAKRRFVATTFWQAAMQTRAARRDDQFQALLQALRHGALFPVQASARFLRWCLTAPAARQSRHS